MTAGAVFRVEVQPLGHGFDAPAGVSLLAAARAAGIVLPSSCRNGTCRTCLCQLREGRVSYLIEWPGLSAEEKLEGCILPCVAMAESALVIESRLASKAAARGPEGLSA